jgi:hypothetical protein
VLDPLLIELNNWLLIFRNFINQLLNITRIKNYIILTYKQIVLSTKGIHVWNSLLFKFLPHFIKLMKLFACNKWWKYYISISMYFPTQQHMMLKLTLVELFITRNRQRSPLPGIQILNVCHHITFFYFHICIWNKPTIFTLIPLFLVPTPIPLVPTSGKDLF